MNPKYPIYVISKGRAKPRQTARALEKCGVPYRIVIEPQELDEYAAVIDRRKILVLPFSNLGLGGIPARNWVWEHSIAEGHARHWILDDNLTRFCRLWRGKRVPMADGTGFAVIEEFVDRYTNVAMAGMQYEMFAGGPPEKSIKKPFDLNTRVYSCILLNNASRFRFRWRGRYNEDTDLSLRFLKAGYCTVLCYAFTARKMPTMKMTGGNTDLLYQQVPGFDGRLEMARSLQRQHPDVVKITRKWGRWQHLVDYRPFKKNRLIRRAGLDLYADSDNFGLRLCSPGGGPIEESCEVTTVPPA